VAIRAILAPHQFACGTESQPVVPPVTHEPGFRGGSGSMSESTPGAAHTWALSFGPRASLVAPTMDVRIAYPAAGIARPRDIPPGIGCPVDGTGKSHLHAPIHRRCGICAGQPERPAGAFSALVYGQTAPIPEGVMWSEPPKLCHALKSRCRVHRGKARSPVRYIRRDYTVEMDYRADIDLGPLPQSPLLRPAAEGTATAWPPTPAGASRCELSRADESLLPGRR
jgi:hypothetical protein